VKEGPEYVIGILCLSKQILAEARPVLASPIRLHLCNTDHAWIRSEVRRYYYPRLRKLYIDTPLLNTDTLDLASFVSLKKIVVGTYFAQFTRRDPKPRLYDRLANIFTSMSKIRYPDVADDVVKEKMLLGSLDRNIKQHSRDLQLKIFNPWLEHILADKTRTFRVIAITYADLNRPYGESGKTDTGNRFLPARRVIVGIKYDLDTLHTLGRKMEVTGDSTSVITVWKWRNGRAVEPSHASPADSTRLWTYADYAEMSDDPDMDHLRPLRCRPTNREDVQEFVRKMRRHDLNN
jgi:hypothetical protein